MVDSGNSGAGNNGNGKQADQDRAAINSVRREIVFLLDDIRRDRDPQKFSGEQLPKLRDLVRRFKECNEGLYGKET
jgi:hypothetical protein